FDPARDILARHGGDDPVRLEVVLIEQLFHAGGQHDVGIELFYVRDDVLVEVGDLVRLERVDDLDGLDRIAADVEANDPLHESCLGRVRGPVADGLTIKKSLY